MARPEGAVLVTGGAGYVAPPAVRALAAAGRTVVVLDDFSTGHRDHVKWGTLVEGDVDHAVVGIVDTVQLEDSADDARWQGGTDDLGAATVPPRKAKRRRGERP